MMIKIQTFGLLSNFFVVISKLLFLREDLGKHHILMALFNSKTWEQKKNKIVSSPCWSFALLDKLVIAAFLREGPRRVENEDLFIKALYALVGEKNIYVCESVLLLIGCPFSYFNYLIYFLFFFNALFLFLLIFFLAFSFTPFFSYYFFAFKFDLFALKFIPLLLVAPFFNYVKATSFCQDFFQTILFHLFMAFLSCNTQRTSLTI